MVKAKAGNTLRPIILHNKAAGKWTFVELKSENKLSKLPHGWETIIDATITLFNHAYVTPEEAGVEVEKLPVAG